MSFLKQLLKTEKSKESSSAKPVHPTTVMKKYVHDTTSKNKQATLEIVKDVFGKDNDFSSRDIEIFDHIPATILYLGSLVDQEVVANDILKPLLTSKDSLTKQNAQQVESAIIKQVIYRADVKVENQITQILNSLLHGNTVLLVEGIENAFIINTFKLEKRSITQPETEQVIRGPRDGFIEDIQTNTSLIRSRLPTPDLRVKSMEIGTLTKSTVVICYIEGVANEALIKEVKSRLSKIEIDHILDTGYIEQFIQDNPRSPFPQVRNTERPDVVVGNLVEGRIVILVDGSPFALIVPATFNQFYQTSEDYNERYIFTSLIRLIRITSLVFSLVIPSLYVAVLSYHPELIPTAFSVAVTSGRASVPFPVVVEVFLMEIAMEILREATVRMPKQVGGALSIVGVLVIGQAAVEAGFVSPITVVVIALSTIGSFTSPTYNMAIGFRMLRFPLLLLAGVFGFYGLMVGLLFINNHVLSLKSFGVPYFSPIAPVNLSGLKDTFIRGPIDWLLYRPAELYTSNEKRLEPHRQQTSNPLSPENQNKKKDGNKNE